MKSLNNDQRIKKAHKDVRELGNIASTILVIELNQIINERIELIKTAPEHHSNSLVSNKAVIQLLETFINPLNA